MKTRRWVWGWCALLWAAAVSAAALPNLFDFADSTGTIATYDTAGTIDTRNPFFQSLGTNGRSCATCHLVDQALSFTPAHAQAVFDATSGSDPLFADVDGANCPGVERSDAAAHSLVLNHGLIRVGLTLPASPEFAVQTVGDPTGCADVTTDAGRQLSVYRRPLPSTNLRFLSAVMFDGRETVAPLNDPNTFAANLVTDLTHQANDATLGHAQAAGSPTDRQLSDIVNFELTLFTAQHGDHDAGWLNAQGAAGGPKALAGESYYPGINDSLGGNPSGAPFQREAFTIYQPWTDLASSGRDKYTAAREQVAEGQSIFNTAPLTIAGVGGLNDALGRSSIPGTCTTCHDTPNVGNHSLPVPLDIGVSHVPAFETDATIRAALAELSLPGLPTFKVTCAGASPRTVFTSDPGKALVSGHCADLNRVKGPILRGLAARAPYFHNGAAATLIEVVNFYNERFQMHLAPDQKDALIAFLRSL